MRYRYWDRSQYVERDWWSGTVIDGVSSLSRVDVMEDQAGPRHVSKACFHTFIEPKWPTKYRSCDSEHDIYTNISPIDLTYEVHEFIRGLHVPEDKIQEQLEKRVPSMMTDGFDAIRFILDVVTLRDACNAIVTAVRKELLMINRIPRRLPKRLRKHAFDEVTESAWNWNVVLNWIMRPFFADIAKIASTILTMGKRLEALGATSKKVNFNIRELFRGSWTHHVRYNHFKGCKFPYHVYVDASADFRFRGNISWLPINWNKFEIAARATLDFIGIHPDIHLFWDCIPFSFVVDWVIPIGNGLESMHQRGWLKPQLVHAGFSPVSAIYHIQGDLKHEGQCYDYWTWAYSPCPINRTNHPFSGSTFKRYVYLLPDESESGLLERFAPGGIDRSELTTLLEGVG